MSKVSSSDVLFVGSVPKSEVADVFKLCGSTAGDRTFALPDGEIGDRSMFIVGLGKLTYARHPHVEAIPTEGLSDFSQACGAFRLKAGVTRTTFDNLPYAEAAVSSYAVFRELREAGEIPEHLRFQVSVPTPINAVQTFFPDVEQWPALIDAFTRGLRMQIEQMLDVIPAGDLAIQWDYCMEILDSLGGPETVSTPEDSSSSLEERFTHHTSSQYLAPLSQDIPDETVIGYHICYGTFGGWPMCRVDDLGFSVRVANRLAANTGRRVDFMHLPVMASAGENFFAPLEDLEVGDTRIFLGLDTGDGIEGLLGRARSARRYLSNFGIAHYCGYGRDDPAELRSLMNDLRSGAEQLAAEPSPA